MAAKLIVNLNPSADSAPPLKMMTGKRPFSEVSSYSQVRLNIMRGLTPEGNPLPQDCPTTLLEVVWKCWRQKPDDRPDLSTLIEDLNLISIAVCVGVRASSG